MGLQFSFFVSFSNINLAIILFFGLLNLAKCWDKPKTIFCMSKCGITRLNWWVYWASEPRGRAARLGLKPTCVNSWDEISQNKKNFLFFLHFSQFWGQFWDVCDAEPLWACAIQLHESVSDVLVIGAVARLRKLAVPSYGVSKREWREEEIPWQDVHRGSGACAVVFTLGWTRPVSLRPSVQSRCLVSRPSRLAGWATQ